MIDYSFFNSFGILFSVLNNRKFIPKQVLALKRTSIIQQWNDSTGNGGSNREILSGKNTIQFYRNFEMKNNLNILYIFRWQKGVRGTYARKLRRAGSANEENVWPHSFSSIPTIRIQSNLTSKWCK